MVLHNVHLLHTLFVLLLLVDKVTYVGLMEKINLDNVISSIYKEARKYIEPEHFLKKPENPQLLLERPIPASYQVVDKHLLTLHKKVKMGTMSPVMHGSEYKKMIRSLKQADLYTDDEIHAATTFLHDVGSVLHFNDCKNDLNDLYFIDPHWLFVMMSAIVTAQENSLCIKHGIIETKHLDILYKDLMKGIDAGFLDQFVVLLDHLEVAIPIAKHCLLIPSMLPDIRPPDKRDPPGMVCRQRHFVFPPGHLTPPGFWSRFLVHILHSVPCVRAVLDHYTQVDLQSSSSLRVEYSIQSSSNDSSQCSPGPVGESQQVDSITPICSISKGDSILKYWKKGMFYQGPSHDGASADSRQGARPLVFFQVEALEDIEASEEVEGSEDMRALNLEIASPLWRGVCITTTPTTEGVQIYGQITDLCEKLLVEWFPGVMNHTKQQIPCYSCLQEKHPRPAIFQKEILMERIDHTVEEFEVRHSVEDATTNKDQFIYSCCNGHRITIPEVAPDILLGDLNQDFLLPHSEVVYADSKILGMGGFGQVYLGTYREKSVAVKLYIKGASAALRKMRNEAIILQRCHHPSLVGMLGVIMELPHLALVLEYTPGGTLKTALVKKTAPLPRIVLFRIAAQIAAGLAFLHQKSYIYRGLVADNVLLWSMRANNLVNCKVADFGLAIAVTPSGAKGRCGTAGFMAPEVVSSEHPTYDQSADAFSFGMVLYQMVARCPPYDFHISNVPKKELINNAVERGDLPKLDDVKVAKIGVPYLAMVMKQCWSYRPKNRPHMPHILRLLCNPLAQLTIGALSLRSQHSIRDACYRVHLTDTPLRPAMDILDSIPPTEFWVCCDSSKGAELQVFNGENFHHMHTIQIGDKRQLKCMLFHNDFLWVASQEGLQGSRIDVFNARAKSHAHSIRMFDCSPCCMSVKDKSIFIGTLEGCVFVLTDDIHCELGSHQTRQKYLTELDISGLQVVDRELWVSYGTTISFHNYHTLKEEGSVSLSVERPHSVGQLALDHQEGVVWGVHVGGITVSAWDARRKQLIFKMNIQEVLSPKPHPTGIDVHPSLVTAFCPVLDTLWCGLDTGHILQFSSHGDALTYFKPFKSYIQFLVPIPEVGPCHSEKAMVLVGGKVTEQVGDLELEVEGDPIIPLNHLPGKQGKGSHKVDPGGSVAGTVLLMEAVSAYHAKQMEYLKKGNTWDSFSDLQYVENELGQFRHLMEAESEPEFPAVEEVPVPGPATPGDVVEKYMRDKSLHQAVHSSSTASTSLSSSSSKTSSYHA